MSLAWQRVFVRRRVGRLLRRPAGLLGISFFVILMKQMLLFLFEYADSPGY